MLDNVLHIVRFCAVECERQGSGEMSVLWMLNGWNYAMGRADYAPDTHDVLRLGLYIEPAKNANGYRRVPVQIGDQIIPWENIERRTNLLFEHLRDLTPGEFFKEYEDIHPWLDGNGRTGQILYNWLNGTLNHPVYAPDFWKQTKFDQESGRFQ